MVQTNKQNGVLFLLSAGIQIRQIKVFFFYLLSAQQTLVGVAPRDQCIVCEFLVRRSMHKAPWVITLVIVVKVYLATKNIFI